MKKAKMAETLLPEWSHKVEADDISLTPLKKTISASPQERKDLARRLNVDSVEFLEAILTLKRNSHNMVIHIEGSLKAKVMQECVVTLEPFLQIIESPVEGWFADHEKFVSITRARHEKKGRASDAELEILEEKDDPEPVVDGEIDLGELVTQHLCLAVDPFPHKDGVKFEVGDDEDEERTASKTRQNPFAALKNWKKKHDNEN